MPLSREAGSGVATGRPAGSTPYLGETGMEMQFRDGASGTVVAECRDTEIGRKYAADVNAGAAGAAQTWVAGYLNSFQAWSYAQRVRQMGGVAGPTAHRAAERGAGNPVMGRLSLVDWPGARMVGGSDLSDGQTQV